MKRVVVISSIWLYSTDSKVLRWVKLCKYLKQMGYSPLLLLPSHPLPDAGLPWDIADDLEQFDRYESVTLGKLAQGYRKLDSLNGLRRTLYRLLNINRLAKQLLTNLQVKLGVDKADVLITSSDVSLFHQLGRRIKQQWKLPWYIDYHFSSKAGFETMFYQRTSGADGLFFSSRTDYCRAIEMGVEAIYHIPNGFDQIPLIKETDRSFSVVYVGSMDETRSPGQLFDVLLELKETEPGFADDLLLHFYGTIDDSIRNEIRRRGLEANFKHSAFLSHSDAIVRQSMAQVLLLVIERTPSATQVTTFKIFDYLIACRPILGIGPLTGEAADLIHETGAGRMFHYKEYRELKAQVLSYYHDYKNRELVVRSRGIRRYHFRNSAKALAEVLG